MNSAALSTVALLALLAGNANAQAQFATRSSVSNWTPRHVVQSGGYMTNAYVYDDGVSENSLGLTNCPPPNLAKVVWIQRFDAQGGSDVITKISTCYGTLAFPGGAPPAGTPVTVAIYLDDISQDGNPNTSTLVASSMTTQPLAGADTDVFQTFLIPPTAVTGRFFVVAWCDAACGTIVTSKFPASLDQTQPSQTRAWAAASDPASAFNPNNLAGLSIPPVELDSIAIPAVWLLRAEGGVAAPTSYCTAKLTANGCSPTIGSTGTASATAGSGFNVTGTNFINNKSCLLFYGVSGRATTPFQGGTLCVNAQIKRTPGTNTFGNPPPNDCSGIPTIDMNSFAVGGLGGTPLAALTVFGTVVDCQWWGRDPGYSPPNNTQLSNALEYTVGQ
jgi:hypothetical protein